MPVRLLITGPTGTIGRHLLSLLARPDVHVTALTRDPARVPAAPAGIEWAAGDLLDPHSVAPLLADTECLFLLVPGIPEEAHCGLTAVALARACGVRRILYLSVHQPPGMARHIPHIAAKLATEEAIRASGIAHAFLRPNAFFQNDLWYKRALLRDGLYPQPFGPIGVSACDAHDIAEAAARLLLAGDFTGGHYDLVGPQALTAEDAARTWSEALGRTIVAPSWDADAWQYAQRSKGLPPWLACELRLMYEDWQANGFVASQTSIDRLAGLLGRPPRSYADFVQATARAWRSQRPG